MGDPRKEKTFVGPMIDEDAAKRVESWIKAARKGGATLLAGGAREGNMLPATLLENVPHDADLYRKEAFGPVAGMESFRSEEHTSELQSLMRISYAVFCLKKKKHIQYMNSSETPT